MSTFLELCQRVCQECSGSGTGPVAVTNQTGEYRRIVNWVANYDRDVQRKRDAWKFMRKAFTVQTVADQQAYAYTDCTDVETSLPIAAFRDWDLTTFKSYLTADGVGGERPLIYMDYQPWYDIYNTGIQIASAPVQFTILHNRSFALAPKPYDIFTVSGEYIRAATLMTANADTPLYPEEFHMIPMWLAVERYGFFTGAPELIQLGRKEAAILMYDMERSQLPDMLLQESDA